MDEKQFEALMERLDLMARLVVVSVLSEKKTLSAKVLALSGVGTRPKDIAWLLGKDPQRIREVLYQQRKRGANSIAGKEAVEREQE